MSRSQHALVIGCGIGGPVVAMALQRAAIDATIFEAFRDVCMPAALKLFARPEAQAWLYRYDLLAQHESV